MTATTLVERFRAAVDAEIARYSVDRSERFLMPTPVAWRRRWVERISVLCEPLVEVAYDSSGMCRTHLVGWDYDSDAILLGYERFCGKTEINHILDDALATFVIADCLAALAYLASMLGGRRASQSFQLQRVGNHRHLMTQALVVAGYWRDSWPDRRELLEAVRHVRFPIERLYYDKAWRVFKN